jgi:hypothetical protein
LRWGLHQFKGFRHSIVLNHDTGYDTLVLTVAARTVITFCLDRIISTPYDGTLVQEREYRAVHELNISIPPDDLCKEISSI